MDEQFLHPLKAEDLLITTYRGEMPADRFGYSMRITHQPTGIVVHAEVPMKDVHHSVERLLIQELKKKLRTRGWILIAEWGAVLVFLLFILTLWGGYWR